MSESINQRMAKVPDLLTSRELRQLLESVLTDLTALTASHNQLLTDYNAHVHGGVTTGSGNTANVADSSATAVTLNTQE
jgi:hypothetical protein